MLLLDFALSARLVLLAHFCLNTLARSDIPVRDATFSALANCGVTILAFGRARPRNRPKQVCSQSQKQTQHAWELLKIMNLQFLKTTCICFVCENVVFFMAGVGGTHKHNNLFDCKNHMNKKTICSDFDCPASLSNKKKRPRPQGCKPTMGCEPTK